MTDSTAAAKPSIVRRGADLRTVSAQNLRAHPARDHCLAPSRAVDRPAVGARYGRLFPDLPALVTDTASLVSIGVDGGPCDPATGGGAASAEAEGAAGWPMFGQFVAHDLTADRSPLTMHADVEGLRNARSPSIDLEPLYSSGPVAQPYLYQRDDPAKLLLSPDGRDVARNSEGTALVGDPRNDVHVFMAQLHLLFAKLHNVLVDRLRDDGVGEADLFDAARRAATWHYQWIVLHDFLPRLVGPDLVARLLSEGPQFFRPDGGPFVPLEFADAAYRYGHGQVRQGYQLQRGGPEYPLFPDLMGLGPCRVDSDVDLTLSFDVPGHEPAQRAPRIDGRLPSSLMALPEAITGTVEMHAHRSLAVRDLQRGGATGLPSGEAVAAAMGVDPLSPDETGLDPAVFRDGAPLWFYILKEAEHRAGGERLGPVGGGIVGEVFVGLLDADPTSQRVVDPGWLPTLPATQDGTFTMADLIALTADTDPSDAGGATAGG
jgi:hypothetical protein